MTRVQSQSIQERERLIEEMEVEVEREETEATARQRETAMMAQEWHQQVWCTCSHADKAHEQIKLTNTNFVLRTLFYVVNSDDQFLMVYNYNKIPNTCIDQREKQEGRN